MIGASLDSLERRRDAGLRFGPTRLTMGLAPVDKGWRWR